MKSQQRLRLRRPDAPAGPSMVFVGGRRFRCQCGAAVFTKSRISGGQTQVYTCNACRASYVGRL